MPADTIQANYTELKTIADRFARQSETQKQAQQRITRSFQALQQGGWRGKGSQAFFSEMSSKVFPVSERLIAALQESAAATRQLISILQEAERIAAEPFRSGNRDSIGFRGQPVGSATSGATAGESGDISIGATTSFGPATQAWAKEQALKAAGIDPTTWDPNKGFVANQETAKKVYDYYGQLFKEHPELLWAGMARVAGQAVFYPGFLQVNTMLQGAENTRWLPPFPGMPSPLGSLSAESLRFLENKFLQMQQEIFTDLAWQHEAYRQGGIDLLRQMSAQGELDRGSLAAWEDIASGNQARIERGNAALLEREQRVIIQDDYDQIRRGLFGVDGKATSAALSLFALSPMPGGEPFQEIVPGGDISKFDDRWRWIEKDMLPRWLEINRNNPGLAQDLASKPLNDSRFDAFKDQGIGIVREEGENFVEAISEMPGKVKSVFDDIRSGIFSR